MSYSHILQWFDSKIRYALAYAIKYIQNGQLVRNLVDVEVNNIATA